MCFTRDKVSQFVVTAQAIVRDVHSYEQNFIFWGQKSGFEQFKFVLFRIN